MHDGSLADAAKATRCVGARKPMRRRACVVRSAIAVRSRAPAACRSSI